MVKKFRSYLYAFWRYPRTWRRDRHRVTAYRSYAYASRGKKNCNIQRLACSDTQLKNMMEENSTVHQNISNSTKTMPYAFFDPALTVEFYTVFQKTCDHIFDDKLKYTFTKIFGTLITKSIRHRQVYLVSHLTYLVHLLYLGKLSRPKYHEFSLKFLIFSMLQY